MRTVTLSALERAQTQLIVQNAEALFTVRPRPRARLRDRVAASVLAQTLVQREQQFGLFDPVTLTSRANLALLCAYSSLERFDEAAALMKQNVQGRQATLISDDPDDRPIYSGTGSSALQLTQDRYLLARVLIYLNRDAEAILLLRQVVGYFGAQPVGGLQEAQQIMELAQERIADS